SPPTGGGGILAGWVCFCRVRGVTFSPRVTFLPPACYHSRDFRNGFSLFARALAASIASFGSLFPRFWLHKRCASRTLERSIGLPPSDIGNISSTSGDCGKPARSFVSTASPQSQQ